MSDSRLAAVRAQMRADGVDVLWIRSTDRFLNEYVPAEDSTRQWITGFTGSMGEALVDAEEARLFVDGRYWVQAEREVGEGWAVVRVPHGQTLDDAVAAAVEARSGGTLGVEADRWTVAELAALRTRLGEPVRVEPLDPGPLDRARDGLESASGGRGTAAPPPRELRVVPSERVGHDLEGRLRRLFADVPPDVEALWVQRLDDIAYLAGLRGRELPHQATFRAVALAARDRLLVGLVGGPPVDAPPPPPGVELSTESDLVERTAGRVVGFDPGHTTSAARGRLEAAGADTRAVALPLARMKAIKSDAEIGVMQGAFRRADRAVARTIRWACEAVVAGETVSEADFSKQIAAQFAAEGAVGSSFRTIAGAGENGAIIHYGHPSPDRALRIGELMLVDCGGYFEEGYATDLTRTFLVGPPDARGDARQRHLYTSVLRAAIAGMTARFPAGTTGGQLDAIVRSVLWSEGLVYAHGTGHGVGINVHEFPPRIAPNHASVLEPNQVFSIEPGVYIDGYGGVRIENLCTLRRAAEPEGFLEVVPLTFSPLDDRLVDRERLSPRELTFLDAFARSFEG